MVTDRVMELMEQNDMDPKNQEHFLVLMQFYVTAMKDLASTLQDAIQEDMKERFGVETVLLN